MRSSGPFALWALVMAAATPASSLKLVDYRADITARAIRRAIAAARAR